MEKCGVVTGTQERHGPGRQPARGLQEQAMAKPSLRGRMGLSGESGVGAGQRVRWKSISGRIDSRSHEPQRQWLGGDRAVLSCSCEGAAISPTLATKTPLLVTSK